MELEQAKDAVMNASKQLVELGLVARTWGNVSCRVGEDHFLITPSGKSYESLSKDQLVLVALADLSYPKGVKPSSEKKLHREVYKQKKDVGCVIHTHQEMASLVGLLGKDIPVSKQGNALLGETIVAARYGLPGTKTLVRNAGAVITSNNATTVLLANHGSLCFGSNEKETLEIAKQLEVECRAYLTELVPLFGEENKEKIETSIPKEATKVASLIEGRDEQQRVILFHTSPAVLEVSKRLEKLPSYLDDFAQIAGAKVVVIGPDAERTSIVTRVIKKCNALLIRGIGALCWASTTSDAEAVVMIVEKNCKAALLALEVPTVKPIGWLDTHLMRFVYQKKYSKIAEGEET